MLSLLAGGVSLARSTCGFSLPRLSFPSSQPSGTVPLQNKLHKYFCAMFCSGCCRRWPDGARCQQGRWERAKDSFLHTRCRLARNSVHCYRYPSGINTNLPRILTGSRSAPVNLFAEEAWLRSRRRNPLPSTATPQSGPCFAASGGFHSSPRL